MGWDGVEGGLAVAAFSLLALSPARFKSACSARLIASVGSMLLLINCRKLFTDSRFTRRMRGPFNAF